MKISESVGRILELAEFFLDYRIKIYENDSVDGTINVINSILSKNLNATIYSEDDISIAMTHRTQRLAYIRNKLLDDTLEKEANFDYICWLDLDGLVGKRFTTESFLSNFKYEALWDAVFPISFPIYYDIWALREKSISPIDIVWHSQHLVPSVINSKKNLHTAVQQLTQDNLSGWRSVESAFGGFGLYKMKIAAKGRYVGMINNEEICEHVTYNESLYRAGARLYINPECITHNP